MVKTKKQSVAESKARLRVRRDTVRKAIKDVQFHVERTDKGTLIITFDMSPESHAVLSAYAEAQGIDLDTLMQDAQKEALVKRLAHMPELKRSWWSVLNG